MIQLENFWRRTKLECFQERNWNSENLRPSDWNTNKNYEMFPHRMLDSVWIKVRWSRRELERVFSRTLSRHFLHAEPTGMNLFYKWGRKKNWKICKLTPTHWNERNPQKKALKNLLTEGKKSMNVKLLIEKHWNYDRIIDLNIRVHF